MVTAATLYMALLGPEGLAAVARACHANTLELTERLCAIDGVTRVFDAPCFHECVLRLETPVESVLRGLKAHGILGGLDLTADYPELGPALLVCATETRSERDLEQYSKHLARILRRDRPR